MIGLGLVGPDPSAGGKIPISQHTCQRQRLQQHHSVGTLPPILDYRHPPNRQSDVTRVNDCITGTVNDVNGPMWVQEQQPSPHAVSSPTRRSNLGPPHIPSMRGREGRRPSHHAPSISLGSSRSPSQSERPLLSQVPCLFGCPPACLPLCLFLYLCICLFVCVCLLVCWSTHLSVPVHCPLFCNQVGC